MEKPYQVCRIITQLQYREAIAFLYSITDESSKETVETALAVADLVKLYEQRTFPKRKTLSPGAALRYLMESNEIIQKSLKEKCNIPQSTLSEILSDKRTPTVAQAKRLGEFFAVDSSLFLDAETAHIIREFTEKNLESIAKLVVDTISRDLPKQRPRRFRTARLQRA